MVFFLTTLDGVGFVGVLVPLLTLVVAVSPLPFALDDGALDATIVVSSSVVALSTLVVVLGYRKRINTIQMIIL